MRKSISQEPPSPMENTSYLTDEESKFISNKNAFQSKQDQDSYSNPKLQEDLANYFTRRTLMEKEDNEFKLGQSRSSAEFGQDEKNNKFLITNNTAKPNPHPTQKDTAKFGTRPKSSMHVSIRPFSSLQPKQTEEQISESYKINEMWPSGTKLTKEDARRLRIKKHKKKNLRRKPSAILTQRQIYTQQSNLLLPPMNLKSLKLVKSKKKRNKSTKHQRQSSNEAESTKYSQNKNSYISKVQQNKTLLSMFKIEKPEVERMKQLGVSTLAHKRLMSARTSAPNLYRNKQVD